MGSMLRPSVARVTVFVTAIAISAALLIYTHRQALFVSAAWDGRVNVMRFLALLGADAKSPACGHRHCLLPLVYAAWGGDEETAEFLAARGADVNDPGNFHATPLMMASFCGDVEMVKLLLKNGADVNLSNDDGNTALSFAKQKNQIAVIRLLRRAGAIDTTSAGQPE